MPAVLQIKLTDIQVCYRCTFYIYFCIVLPDLGGLKITLLETILSVPWCAVALLRLKRQGLYQDGREINAILMWM